jgi:hypothetical protein
MDNPNGMHLFDAAILNDSRLISIQELSCDEKITQARHDELMEEYNKTITLILNEYRIQELHK